MIRFELYKTLRGAGRDLTIQLEYQARDRGLLTVYGPSGAGKSTLLRMLAGLTVPDSGYIEVNGICWYDSRRGINLAPRQRRVGFVFQERSLFPHLSVRQNLAFGMEHRDPGAVNDILRALELDELGNAKPAFLSGGQRQRVELGRAILRNPALLLLDEPLSALDSGLRGRLQRLVLEFHRARDLHTILVSHDLPEIAALSERVIHLENGRIRQAGSPESVFFSHPLSGKVQFTGRVLAISREDILHVITVLAANTVIKVVVGEEQAAALSAGDAVIISSKAFNPLVSRITGDGEGGSEAGG
ncbi:MAG TPA: ATP-binding cassette domain-containing protein [Chitinophagaceae bacterium]|nr:ATP-binding cassette domain-containing protein [Chitinophagaceae bacterium]